MQTPTAHTVNEIANTWIAKHPELRARIERAIALVANVEEPGPFGPGTFYVEGSEGKRYMVSVKGRHSECTCLDSTKNGNHCKHRLAAALYVTGARKEAP
jgi:hypothetical protein